MKFEILKRFKTKTYEVVINLVYTRYGIRYHVYGSKIRNNIYYDWFPSKTFKTKSLAFAYAKSYMKKH